MVSYVINIATVNWGHLSHRLRPRMDAPLSRANAKSLFTQEVVIYIAQVAAQDGSSVVKGYCGHLNHNFLYKQSFPT